MVETLPNRSALRREELRARARRDGVERLAVPELIELVLGRGKSGRDAVWQLDLVGWSRAAPAELSAAGGLSRIEAARLAASFALGRAVEVARQGPRPVIRSSEAVFRYLAAELRGLEQEHFLALLLDGKHRLKACRLVSKGTLTTSLVHPREVFRPAVQAAAAAVVVAHNHPSGDPEPSAEDLEVTRRLLDAGRLLGIPLLDHVVLGDQAWVSIRERIDFK